MIWGKTTIERKKKQQAKEKKWFAWYPIHLVDGRWVWLEYVSYETYGSWDGTWCEFKLYEKGEL